MSIPFRKISWTQLLIFTAIITFITSCGHTKKEPTSAINTECPNRLNSIAVYLAGMRTDSSSADTDSIPVIPYYSSYRDSMDKAFTNIEYSRLSQMRQWSKVELPIQPNTVFYPFSGPDILHCIQFFPEADQYIMIGLERYGSLQSFDPGDTIKIKATLDCLYGSLSDIFGKSFFFTRKMLTDVSNPNNGVIPLACLSLVRTGYSILDIKYKHLIDGDGCFREIAVDSLDKRSNDCVEIYFRKNGGKKVQKLIYFRNNLADDPYDAPDYFIELNKYCSPNNIPGLKLNKDFREYLDHLPECYGYIKSASYLMFQPHFTLIRQICLDRCKLILQDDTGIPYELFVKNNWSPTLYGRYERSISIFHGGYFQSRLDSIYKADSLTIKKLPFSIGYHYEDQVQNLMKFEKN